MITGWTESVIRAKAREKYAAKRAKEGREIKPRQDWAQWEKDEMDKAETPEERVRIRSRLYYRRNRAHLIQRQKDWKAKHRAKGYFPQRLAHLDDPVAAYRLERNAVNAAKKRKEKAEMTEEEKAAHRVACARKQRERREKNGDKVREYQREYFRQWARENPDKVREIQIRYHVKTKAEKEIVERLAKAKAKAAKKTQDEQDGITDR